MKLVEGLNPTTLAKSQKSLADAEHIRQAMEQDGAALCEFFAWLDSALGRERITELTIDENLTAARTRRPGYVSLSFNTIAAFNANGAMPHYHATEEEHAVIEGRRSVADRLRRPVPGRHHRHHADGRRWARRRMSRNAIARACSKA